MEKSSPRFTQLKQLTATKYNSIIRAIDSTTHAPVIIKAPRAEYINEQRVRNALLHETEILKMLVGTKCIQSYVTSGIEHEKGFDIPYLITQEVRGRTLYDVIRDDDHRGRFHYAEGIALLRILAQALFSVHEIGIVHCDLKLGNILWNDEEKMCTIMDWGAATHMPTQKRAPSDPVVGTAQFMSYEHVTGAILDQRTDIYALGIIITLLVYGQELTPRYAVVNGQVKKRSKDETADCVAQKETIKVELLPPPVSSLDWSLRQLLIHMTQWDREARPRSLEYVTQECRRILSNAATL